jgi:hypothetical protein
MDAGGRTCHWCTLAEFVHGPQLVAALLVCCSRKIAGSSPDEVDFFLNLPNPSSRIMVLGSTQPLPEMSISNLTVVKGRPARKADNLTTICEPTV